MVYYRIAWCIKKEKKYCFGNWQPSDKILELEHWVHNSNRKSDCYYWIEQKDSMFGEINNYNKTKSSLTIIDESDFVAVEKI